MKWAQLTKPNPENCKNCSSSVLMTLHSFSTQYNTEQFDNSPSYLQITIIAQMLSIGREGPGCIITMQMSQRRVSQQNVTVLYYRYEVQEEYCSFF